MDTADPRSVVDAYLNALRDRDHERARQFLADRDFAYRSPISCFQSADELVQYLSLASGIVQGVEVRKVFVDGDDICHFLTYRIQISEKQAVDVAQWARVRDGRIACIDVVFDASEYRVLFDLDETPG
jgi:limonene-1,2-epoxide hydrolase